jgi:O-antigen ligase
MSPAQTAVWLYLLTFALPLPVDFGLLGLGFLGAWTALKGTAQFPPRALFALLPLALATVLGNFIAPDPSRSLSLTLALLPACVIYLLICGYFELSQLVGLSLAASLMICSLGGWLLGVAVSHPASSPDEWIRQSHLTAFKVPNDVVFFQILLPFALAQLKPKISMQSVLAAAACGIAVSVAVIYQSRLAVLTALAGGAVFFALRRTTKSALWSMLLLAFGIAIVDTAFGFKLLGKFSSSWTSRLPLWLAAWQMFLCSPWTGHGIGSYALHYRNYLDWAHLPPWIAFDPRPTPWAHNLYLEVLAELGAQGLAALLFFLVSPLLTRPKYLPAPQIRMLACAAKAAWLAFALSAFFELSLWRQWVGLVFLLTTACITATNKFQEGAP